MTPIKERVIERSRIDFECYFLESRKSKGANRAPTFMRHEQDGTYIDDHTQRHWWTWQQAVNAGRDQGLREAKEVCALFAQNTLSAQSGNPNDLSNVMLRQVAELGHNECAAAIEQLRGRDGVEALEPSRQASPCRAIPGNLK